jgi:hypothetical protein
LKDPRETRAFAPNPQVSRHLHEWMDAVRQGLIASDRLGPAEVDPENVEQLRALGYIH